MDPNTQPQQPDNTAPHETPQAVPAPTRLTQPAPASRSRKLKIWGIVLLVGPTALFVLTTILYAFVSLISPAPVPTQDSSALFGEEPNSTSIANTILFLIGTVSVLTWLPGIIIGVILLGKSKRA